MDKPTTLDPLPRYTDGERRSASYRDEQGLLGIKIRRPEVLQEWPQAAGAPFLTFGEGAAYEAGSTDGPRSFAAVAWVCRGVVQPS